MNKINTLAAVGNRVYVGSDAGLFLYDPMLDNLTRAALLSEHQAILMLHAYREDVFVGTSRSLYRITNQEIHLLSHDHTGEVRALTPLSQDRFMVFMGSQLKIIDRNGNPLLRFSGFELSELERSDFTVHDLYTDWSGQVWLASNYGLFLFEEQKNRFTKINLSSTENRENNTVRTILGDRSNLLYLGTEDGIYSYDLQEKQVKHYTHSYDHHEQKLNDKAIYSSFISTDGTLWFGTYFGGVNYIPSSHYGFKTMRASGERNRLHGKAVSQLMEDQSGRLWIGTEDGGITIHDSTEDRIDYINGSSTPFYLSINNVHALHQDQHGDVWVGTFLGGLHRFKMKEKTTQIFRHSSDDQSSISNDNIYAIFTDSQDRLWIGTQRGLNIFDRKEEQFSLFKPAIFENKFIYDMIEGPDSSLWFCTRADGIYRYWPTTDSLKHYRADSSTKGLQGNQIISAYRDHDDRIWFGSLDGGVCYFDYSTDQFYSLTTHNGLVNNSVYGILEDTQGMIWMSTNKGLTRYDPHRNQFSHFNSKHGLPSNQFNFKSFLKAADGTLYFGSVNGLSYFHAEDIQPRKKSTYLLLSDFSLFNKSVDIAESDVLSNHVNYLDGIALDHNQNVFSIDFTALDFANPESIQFQYFLEGFEEEWNQPTEKRRATYTNLAPGAYTFQVKAVQADGSDCSAVRSLQIQINPPFYKTTFAYVLYAFLMIAAVAAYGRFVRFLHERKLELNLARLEKEKTDELTQNRLNFFTFISHEFKTPLTLILAAIDKLTAEGSRALQQNPQIAQITKSASTLFELIQELMEFRSAENNHSKIELAHEDIVGFLVNVVSCFRSLANEKGLSLEIRSEIPQYMCYFDQQKLERIIINLLSNALKNTVHGGVEVSIGIKTDSTKDWVRILVSDTGSGMGKKEIENAFKPFFNKGKNREGSGIGLPLMYSLVHYLGGIINITSPVSGGTTVVVELPLNNRPATPVEKSVRMDNQSSLATGQSAKQVEFPITSENGRKKYSLLIVEDNKELLGFLSEHFSKNYQVDRATNGAMAKRKILKLAPDIIVSDVKMPKIDGLELCRFVKQHPDIGHTPFIMLSQAGDQGMKLDGLDVGADTYLAKPFKLKELELIIENMLWSRKVLRERIIHISEFAKNKLPENNKDEEFLKRLSAIFHARFMDSNLSVDDLAKEMYMSRTSLHLKLKKALGKNATTLLAEYRLRRASIMLKNDIPINEIAFHCGYNDPSYFSRIFKKYYGLSPMEFKLQSADLNE